MKNRLLSHVLLLRPEGRTIGRTSIPNAQRRRRLTDQMLRMLHAGKPSRIRFAPAKRIQEHLPPCAAGPYLLEVSHNGLADLECGPGINDPGVGSPPQPSDSVLMGVGYFVGAGSIFRMAAMCQLPELRVRSKVVHILRLSPPAPAAIS